MNKDLRKRIVDLICTAGEGHIPSAFSIIDILAYLYKNELKFDATNPHWDDRDFFILSKGHGCAALYVLLAKYGFFPGDELKKKSKPGGILGGHPDKLHVPGAEASTGSLGHGFPFAMGTALGLRIKQKSSRVFVLIGDGESNEGTIWETAAVAANLELGNLCCILDNNGSAAEVLPMSDQLKRWEAFGWEAYDIDGHSQDDIKSVFQRIRYSAEGKPKVIIANTIKGKGVGFLQGHGVWHYKIPNAKEYDAIMQELS